MAWKYVYEEEDEKRPAVKPDTDTSYSVSQPAGFDDSVYQAAKPAYTSSYADRIDNLLGGLENREEFRYDPESDPLYRQYRTQYRREGSRAVDDTLASAASHAGGMNSYAVTAAQQAGDYYNAKLMDALPELAQLAYQMYQADYDEDVGLVKLLQSREAEDYDRYQDALDRKQWQQSFDYNASQDALDREQWQQSFDYNASQDALDREQWQQNFDYNAAQDALDREQWQQSFDYNAAQDALDREQWQKEFDYNAGRDSVSDSQWREEMDYKKNSSSGVRWNPGEQEYVAPGYAQSSGSQSSGAQSSGGQSSGAQSSADPYAGTDFFQAAIDAALQGDRATAEAALAMRAQKMASPDYHGTGGGTSMAEAYAYIESLLAGTEEK